MNDLKQSLTRRGFLGKAGAAGLGLAGVGLLSGRAEAAGPSQNGLIVTGATYAEALASTMYYNIIATTGGVYQQLGTLKNANDQAYLVAGLEQEVNHYAVLRALGGPDLTGMKFYFPVGMFTDNATTVNTLTTLEDAFISAYIVGVRDFSVATYRVYAAQILGVEAEHRAFARVIASDLGLGAAAGLAGSEKTDGPANAANNLSYERPFLPNISGAFTALTPFITDPATAKSGFSPTPYTLPTVTLNGDGSGSVVLPAGVAAVALANKLPGTPGMP